MTPQEFEQTCMRVVRELRALAPKDTGNLAYNAIKYEWVNETTFRIYVDEKIAPYMPYTTESWSAARWKGKRNPNEGWFDRAAEFSAALVAGMVKGELKKK